MFLQIQIWSVSLATTAGKPKIMHQRKRAVIFNGYRLEKKEKCKVLALILKDVRAVAILTNEKQHE